MCIVTQSIADSTCLILFYDYIRGTFYGKWKILSSLSLYHLDLFYYIKYKNMTE